MIGRTPRSLACLVVLLASASWAGESKVRAPVEELFREPMYRRVIVSPGGSYVAAEFFDGESFQIELASIGVDGQKQAYTIYETPREAWVSQLLWADPDSLLITVDKRRRNFGTRRESVTYVADVSAGPAAAFAHRFREIEVRGAVVDPLPAIEDEILYSPSSDPSAVYRLNLSGLPAPQREGTSTAPEGGFPEDSLVARVEGDVQAWITDARGIVRCAVSLSEDPIELRVWHRAGSDSSWEIVIAQPDPERFWEIIPLGVSVDGSKLLVATDRDRDRFGLYEYDPETRELGQLIYEHPSAEIIGVIYDYSGTQLLGATYLDIGEMHYAYLDSGDRLLRETLVAAFPARSVMTTSSSSDGRRLSLLVSSPDDPGAFYLVDLDSRTATQIGKVAPWLDNNVLGEVRAFKVKSTDGIEVDAFLTQPPLVEEPPPLVVMPHGGPVGVMDRRVFDPAIQYLARSGFAVLQVNYRGSGGYGRAFREAGYREWGRGIEDDIDAAVDHVMERGWVDPDRMCAVGGSYGGYSALMSVVRHPERYRCAATYAGVTDIALLFSSSDWASHHDLRRRAVEVVGDPGLEYEELRSHSPVYRAEAIRIPLFLAHGLLDRRVDVDHAYRLKAMLDLHGVPLRWSLMRDEGHGFASRDTEIHYYLDLREFLAEHLRE